jgi:hypothetical protein
MAEAVNVVDGLEQVIIPDAAHVTTGALVSDSSNVNAVAVHPFSGCVTVTEYAPGTLVLKDADVDPLLQK